jgi:hypothetical protein
MWQGVENIFGGAIKIILGVMKGWAGVIGAAATGVWGALKTGLIDAVNWIIGKINTVINAVNSVTNSIPGIGGNLVSPLGLLAAPAPPAPANAPAIRTAASQIGAAHAQHAVHATMNRAALFGSGDVVIKVGAHEFARIARREIFKSMAANA